MAKILYEIPSQKFELILDRIGIILTEELARQFIIIPNPLFQADVWKERFIAFDKTELPAINLFYENSEFNENTPITSKGEIKYNIELVVSAKHTDSERADTAASLKCHKLLGVIRYILENPNYLRLDFPVSPAFIAGTNVESIRMSEPSDKDGIQSIGGQIVFNIRVEEYNGEIQPVTAEGYTTQVKLNNTEKGYKFEINN